MTTLRFKCSKCDAVLESEYSPCFACEAEKAINNEIRKEKEKILATEQQDMPYYAAAYGWICPRCGAGNAPSASRCGCVPIDYGQMKVTC